MERVCAKKQVDEMCASGDSANIDLSSIVIAKGVYKLNYTTASQIQPL